MTDSKMHTSNYDLQVDLAKSIFLEYDQDLLIHKFSLSSDSDWIFITYFGVSCRIDRKDAHVEEFACGAWRECRSYNTVMTIYDLLCHHKGEFAPALFGTWCTVGSFTVTGFQNTDTFTKKYAEFFQDHIELLHRALLSLGGTEHPSASRADITYVIPVTTFFPVMFQFWEGDDEFPPQIMLMWDKNAISFLHFETTFFLQGDLLERIKNFIASVNLKT